jgi:hypothetical protein
MGILCLREIEKRIASEKPIRPLDFHPHWHLVNQKMGLNNLHRHDQFSTLYYVELVEILKPSGKLTLKRILEQFESRGWVKFSVNLSKAKKYSVIARPALGMSIIKRPVRDVDRRITLGEAAPISRKKQTFPIKNCRICGISTRA